MATTIRTERRLLAADEFEQVQRTHHPELGKLGASELAELRRRIREMRDKAQDIARRQRREMRGKEAPRGARPAGDHTGTSIKAALLAAALKRLNRANARQQPEGHQG